MFFDPVVLSQAYDPLSPDDYVASFTATGRRSSSHGVANYSAVLLRHGNFRLPTELFVIRDDGAGSGSVLYERPGPRLANGINDAGEIDLQFNGGAGESVTARTIDMMLRIPAGTELAPGDTAGEFDVKYLCDYLEGRTDRGNANRAFIIHFPVNAVVDASLVGTQPDFGEIGTLSDIDVAGAPPSTTQRRHYMRVASTGPYQVSVVSQNGWRMTASGGPTGNDAERISYSYELLGQTLDSGKPNFTPVICETSGVSGENIPMTAKLLQGGQGKVPSSVYRDIVTITVTPLSAVGSGAQRCD